MKVCPECNSVYGDDLDYCSDDGTILVEKNLILPTGSGDAEAETVIRRNSPIVVDLNAPTAEASTPDRIASGASPIIVEKTSNSKYYALFLVIGLMLGGGLVLATLLAAKYINRPVEGDVSVQTKAAENKSQEPENISAERADGIDQTAGEFHRARDFDRPDEDFNGRVIVENANVRAAPAAGAEQVGILPDADRIMIERRENENSPWYYVVCEHGARGWMHGNTIEFTYGNF